MAIIRHYVYPEWYIKQVQAMKMLNPGKFLVFRVFKKVPTYPSTPGLKFPEQSVFTGLQSMIVGSEEGQITVHPVVWDSDTVPLSKAMKKKKVQMLQEKTMPNITMRQNNVQNGVNFDALLNLNDNLNMENMSKMERKNINNMVKSNNKNQKKGEKRKKKKKTKRNFKTRINGTNGFVKNEPTKKERYAIWREERKTQKKFIQQWTTQFHAAQEWLFQQSKQDFAYTTWTVSKSAKTSFNWRSHRDKWKEYHLFPGPKLLPKTQSNDEATTKCRKSIQKTTNIAF